MSRILALGLMVAAVATPVLAAPPPQPIDGGPALTWRTRPTHMQKSRIAHNFGNPVGWAEIECVIDKRGRPDDCTVISEQPAGHRLGKMAIAMARMYRASRSAPSEGRRVRYIDGSSGTYIP